MLRCTRLASSFSKVYRTVGACSCKATNFPDQTAYQQVWFSNISDEAALKVGTQFQEGSQNLSREATVRRLVYRSQQRGFLELDLVVGRWVEDNIASMSDQNLTDLIMVLDEENPDLFKWLTGQGQAPQDMLDNPVFVSMSGATEELLKNRTSVLSRTPEGKEWMRGWSDGGKEMQLNGPKWVGTQ
mmetsp:Transcript_25962/g.35836  ORF Transcript_25962/g.35836 Transcript_25962/m.35836 type:complete len:186 (-) Transcript_25962:102-659(-)|eukprot:CAMPEP_0196597824 /NCGR_PEP_ID=MMETSP1081-20130531/93180_1 /TAXON_ID=36882 /ORGANISM="Pyramimonas amylifera, Strain CCMP720" /LENGTH=185 /DNA_ID=CAMNT_0041923361 /DNA_START=35 /DNA_END=592 /DNA_ORIENTATION=+